MNGLNAVSLFAGVEGFGLALARCEVPVVASVEIDPECRGVIARHFPESRLFDDVRKVTGDDLRAAGFVPERGILTAGWPCQGNSVAGGRGGLADPRSGLWRHVVRLLAETRPRWFIGENVPGLLSVNDGEDLAVVRGDLAQLGYWWAERVLDSQHFGVPQRRRRLFFVGCPGDRISPVEVLLEPESGAGHSPARRKARADIAGTLGSRAGGSRTTDLDGHGAYITPLLEVSARTGRSTDDPRVGIGIGEEGADADPEDLHGLREAGALQVALREALHAGEASGHAAPGLNGGGGVSLAVRRLTPRLRECERLQDFPDEWTRWKLVDGELVELSDSARYRMIGNAVSVCVPEWILRRLVAVEQARGAESGAA